MTKTKKEYPKIRGGICDFCGIPAKECPHFKELFDKGEFGCLCGSHNNQSTYKQSIYFYSDKLGAWICNSEGCRKRVEAIGGYKYPEVLKFYLP